MTTIVINAVSVREGGSLVVLRTLLSAMAQQRPAWQWHVITNAMARGQLPEVANATYHVVPAAELAPWRIRWWYETALPRLLMKLGADLLYSQTNYLPLRRLQCPSLLLVQHAGHFSPVFDQLTARQSNWWARLNWRLKGRWVRSSVRHATRVTVQTAALAQDIATATSMPASAMTVIAHGPGLITGSGVAVSPPQPGQALRIGYITKAGVQKNFDVVLKAAAQLQQQGLPFTLVLTLDPMLPENRAVLAQADRLGLADVVDNCGELAADAIVALYRSLHCFVFASLCESFGFPLVEALVCGLPLCIAETASNREVAGNAGLWFAADDAVNLAVQLGALAQDPHLFSQQAQLSLARGESFSWPAAAAANVALIESLLPARAGVTRS